MGLGLPIRIERRTRGEAVREIDEAVREGDEAVSVGDEVGRRRGRERNEAEVVSAGNVQASVRSEEHVRGVVALTLTCTNSLLVTCIFQPEQLTKIFELCGTPDEVNWPGVSKMPWYNNFKPAKPMKRRVRELFKHFDRHALELLERMLMLDPSQRISAKDALDAEYFWADPLPCDPKSLPKYESSHEFQTKKKRQQQRQHEEMAKRQKLQHPQPHARLPPIQQTGQPHPQMWPGPGQPIHNAQPQMAAGPSHHYGKPRGPSGGPNRYPQGGNPGGGYNPNHPNRGGQGGGYSGGPYPQQGRGPPYAGGNMPGAGGPRGGGGGAGYGAAAGNYPQGGPYGASGANRGPNMGANRNQYNWQ
ncbi:cyclin-dependent kinase C-2-like [Dendrobium catenatum]|uniref:cyclin-dependent kinase C-2-like n=1 Tax=Dendrobium catenatum TaxID=906689 RepID=UPI00109F4FB7|nr:cyclin-dependent kinase C-2-like [Dendrobium catenatum]